jgi:hypothetical protein
VTFSLIGNGFEHESGIADLNGGATYDGKTATEMGGGPKRT